MKIGERLRRAVERAGLTQREVARRSGLEEATVSDLLNGKTRRPAFDSVERVVKAIGTSFSELFDEPRLELSAGDAILAQEFRDLLSRLLQNSATQQEMRKFR